MNPPRPDEAASLPGDAGATPASPEELRADIERTREQLGDTVEALVAKTDVKARAVQRGSTLARDVTGSAARQADKLAGRLETAAARAAPPTPADPARARRTARQAATGLAALTAAGGVIAAWLSRRGRRS
jgi:Protein of unknown function (DUF3618)